MLNKKKLVGKVFLPLSAPRSHCLCELRPEPE